MEALVAGLIISMILNFALGIGFVGRGWDIEDLNKHIEHKQLGSGNNTSGPFMRLRDYYVTVHMNHWDEYWWYKSNSDPKQEIKQYVEVYISRFGGDMLIDKFLVDDPNHDDLLRTAWTKAEDRISTYESLV